MNTLRRILGTAILVAAVFSIPALAQKVETDYDHTASFSNYHTYSWGQVHSTDPFFEGRIREAVNHVLAQKGWRLVPMDGDVTLTAGAFTKRQHEYTTFYDGLGGWRWHGWGGMTTTTVDSIPVGTLVVDIYETASERLLWRGLAYDQLSNNPDKDTKKLEKAVDKMFAKFPPEEQM